MKTDDARSLPDVPRLRRALLGWYRREARDLPWRRTRDPYAVWISEVMLQQTTVATVIPYYERFLSRFPDLASLAASDEEELLALWSGLGYYRRARNLRSAARIIMERHIGRFPKDPAAIEALPGVGRYTAGAIASNCFDLPLAAVDTNAARVLARVYAVAENGASFAGSAPGERAINAPTRSRTAAIWRIAEELVPTESPGDWTQALMELGATICRPASPDCGICPVATDCGAFASGDLAPYSLARPRSEPITVHASLVVLERGSAPGRPRHGRTLKRPRILLVRRDADELLGGLWELPGTLADALAASTRRASRRGAAESRDAGRRATPGPEQRERRTAVARALQQRVGFEPNGLARAAEVPHTVTHRRLRISIWTATAPTTAAIPAALRPPRGERHLWADPRALAQLPVGAASIKALAALGPAAARTRPKRTRGSSMARSAAPFRAAHHRARSVEPDEPPLAPVRRPRSDAARKTAREGCP